MGKPNVHHVNLWDVVRSALTASLPMPDTWKTALRRQRVIYTRPANYLATSPWGVGIIFSIIEKTTGWWYTYPSEKYELTYESVWMMTFPIYGKSEKSTVPVTTNQKMKLSKQLGFLRSNSSESCNIIVFALLAITVVFELHKAVPSGYLTVCHGKIHHV